MFWVFGVYGRGVTQVLLSPVSGPGPIFQPLVPMMAPMESTAAASVVSPPSSSSGEQSTSLFKPSFLCEIRGLEESGSFYI